VQTNRSLYTHMNRYLPRTSGKTLICIDLDDIIVQFYCVILHSCNSVYYMGYANMLQNSAFVYPYRYDRRDKPFSHASLNKLMSTLTRTLPSFEKRYIKPEELPQLKMPLVLGVQSRALEGELALIVIIAFMRAVGQGMEISLVYTMIIGTFLSERGSTYRSQLQLAFR